METDLQRLIRLQQLDTFADNARRRVAEHPTLIEALDGRLAAADTALAQARQRNHDGQAVRRDAERDLAAVQGRLSKYKDQLMAVKTNKEYQAMLKEIESAQAEVRRLEDRVLEQMLANDDLTSDVKAAEAKLSEDKQAVAAERARLEKETQSLEVELERVVAVRRELVAGLPPTVLTTYETIAKGRRGLALAEARAGLCTACHVRLRPQVFNELRSNEVIRQCDSCNRILYFVEPGTINEPNAGMRLQ